MKNVHKILTILFVFAIFAVFASCENEIKTEEFASVGVDFRYQSTSIDYVIGEEISFINKSIVGSSYEWHFGDGQTSNEKDPVHKYTTPGTYKVKLIVDGGEYELEKSIMISDIVPVVSFSSTDESIIYNQSEVLFEVKLQNPENLEVSYRWTFPGLTEGEGVDENFVSELPSPKVIFGTIGSQDISLSIKMGDKQLDPVSVNVPVNYDKPVKTLYYAVKDGNLMARKIIMDDIDQSIIKPVNLGYRSGKHPLSLQFGGDWLYVFDAGSKISYVADPTGQGDGEIFAVSHDGEKRETVIDNFGGSSYYDFYYGYVDLDNNTLYWADRRDGIFKTSLESRNMKFSLTDNNYFVMNNWLGYYGKGISYGNVNGPITKIGDTFLWAKNSNGAGLFRFVESDIKGSAVDPDAPVPASGAILNTYAIRGMAIDKVNNHIYVASQAHKMIFCFDLTTGVFVKLVDRPGVDDQVGGQTETVFVSGMAIDVDENGDGYLYYAYRGPAGSDVPAQKSGIKRYKLKDAAATPEFVLEGVEAYGLTIDHTLR